MKSYREKELLMVDKYLYDESLELKKVMQQVLESIEAREPIESEITFLPVVETYEDFVHMVKDAGYDTYIRVEDLLSEEELKVIDKEYKEINDEFKRLTKLEKVDVGFIVAATALQLIRQVLQPKLDFESLSKNNRVGDKDAAKNAKNKEKTKKSIEDKKDAISEDSDVSKSKKFYYASVEDIADIKHVPYDTIKGSGKSGKFPAGLNGNNHRYKTLGHDPYLGYLFGTCNILTNTMTLNNLSTYHISNREISNNADIVKMFKYSYDRFCESKITVVIALLKQYYHIKSDVKSKNGLPLPFVQLLCGDKYAKKLSDMGFDYNSLDFLKDVAVQAGFSEMINFIVGVSHRILMAIEEAKEQNLELSNIEAIKQYDLFSGDNELKEVRTRKILLISNSLATAANAAFVGALVAKDVAAGNPNVAKSLENLDVGGAIVTIYHLFKDIRFITKLKKDFIAKAIDEDFQKKLTELDVINVSDR